MSEVARRAMSARQRTAIWLAVGTGLVLLLGANWHLVHVALTSQPECVAHLRQGESRHGGFSAARSACSTR
ncbi:hypothetical protein [Bosea sp. (in: a-proteobacteria)]|uniref:hypothetical protein n=1 Tax=Bosea sp. (in: a-proteobacteria) TaxID=1871050 RepID=UPI002FC77B04